MRSEIERWARIMSPVATDLALEFRESAQVFREHAQESVAIAYERCAERVEEAFDEQSGVLLSLQEAAVESGLPRNEDFNGERQEGAGLYQLNQKDGQRHSAADAYLRPALGRRN